MNQVPVRSEINVALAASLLVMIAMWTYHGATGNLFVWDSEHYLFIYEDHFSRLNFENIKWMATTFQNSNWHPLTWLSWAIDYQIYGGLDPWGFHLSNNFLHAINSVLVFFLILIFFSLVGQEAEKFSLRKDNNALIAAFLASLLFVVHPQHVESVAWVAERKDLLCQLFMLLSLFAYVKYVTCSQTIKTRWYLAALGLFFLAVLSKPMAVTFPVVLLLADVYPLRRTRLTRPIVSSIHLQSIPRLIVEKIPFFFLALVLIIATLVAQQSAISDYPLMARIINAVHASILYIQKFIFPYELSPHYPYFIALGGQNVLKALLVFSIFLGISVITVLAWRKHRQGWMIAWLFYLVTLSPVLGLIKVGTQGAADRYAYFPTLPLYLLLAYGILWALQRGAALGNVVLLLTAISVTALFAVQTHQQIGIWQSDLSLWSHAVKTHPNHVFSRNNLGVAYMDLGDYENAAIQFEASGAISSVPTRMLARRGVTYMYLGRYKESIMDHVDLGVASETGAGPKINTNCIQYNIGWNYAQLGMHQEAIDLFERVDSDSMFGSSASDWLVELRKSKSLDNDTILNQSLRLSCDRILSRSE